MLPDAQLADSKLLVKIREDVPALPLPNTWSRVPLLTGCARCPPQIGLPRRSSKRKPIRNPEFLKSSMQ
jgi:hypothetical protein